MKTIEIIIVVTIISIVLALLQIRGEPEYARATEVIDTNPPPQLIIAGGVSGNWLTIGRANLKDPLAKGYDPSYTYILTDFEPRVHRMKNGKWIIQFECSICKDLP
jgi:hypothetical protein